MLNLKITNPTNKYGCHLDYEIHLIDTEVAEVWIIEEKGEYNYVYGGTRKIPFQSSEEAIEEELLRLMTYESHMKNAFINRAVSRGAVDSFKSALPPGFRDAHVGGGRCVFKAKNERLDKILCDPTGLEFDSVIRVLFENVGEFLNRKNGRIKLTPDFGRYAGVSDVLNLYTPHVIGIKCENGGCGGKSSYTSTGILSVIKSLNLDKSERVTLIGSDGALGRDICQYFIDIDQPDFKVCDLNYQKSTLNLSRSIGGETRPLSILPAEWGKFTTPCLSRGGTIIATTVGNELENSDIDDIPSDTKLIMAHNHVLPKGREGIQLARQLEEKGCLLIPGQILTLGGALTSRFEWYFRQTGLTHGFDKKMAHSIADVVVSFLMSDVLGTPGETFYEKTLNYVGFKNNTKELNK